MSTAPVASAPPAWVLSGGGSRVEIWGLAAEERARRSLERAGCSPVSIVESNAPPELPHEASLLVFRGDVVADERLVSALAARPDTVLATSDLGPVAGHVPRERAEDLVRLLRSDAPHAGLADVQRVDAAELAPAYVAKLRKWQPAFVYPARPERVREIESRLFTASYKGATDLVTKWIWPRPAAAVTRVCARAGIHPNGVTLASWFLAIAAMVLFAKGNFGSGLVAAWLMTFLDTVDGKLARVTLTSSRIGDVLDHGLDLVHPPFWYLAWGIGLPHGIDAATVVVVAGYLAGRLLEGAFLAAFGMETHSWRPIDSLFRTITARRNPNLILLTVGTLGGRPDLGMWMVALWTAISLSFHAVRLLQAFALRRRGETITAWEAERAMALRAREGAESSS
jgi:phosphatidylglycerophosphate synthase